MFILRVSSHNSFGSDFLDTASRYQPSPILRQILNTINATFTITPLIFPSYFAPAVSSPQFWYLVLYLASEWHRDLFVSLVSFANSSYSCLYITKARLSAVSRPVGRVLASAQCDLHHYRAFIPLARFVCTLSDSAITTTYSGYVFSLFIENSKTHYKSRKHIQGLWSPKTIETYKTSHFDTDCSLGLVSFSRFVSVSFLLSLPFSCGVRLQCFVSPLVSPSSLRLFSLDRSPAFLYARSPLFSRPFLLLSLLSDMSSGPLSLTIRNPPILQPAVYSLSPLSGPSPPFHQVPAPLPHVSFLDAWRQLDTVLMSLFVPHPASRGRCSDIHLCIDI